MRFTRHMKIVFVSVIVLMLLLLLSLRIYLDYTWSDKTIQEFGKKGFTVLAATHNYRSYLAPWSFINTPITAIWFTRVSGIKKYSPYLSLPVVTIQYKYYERTAIQGYVAVFNTATHQETVLSSDAKIQLVDETWYNVNRSPNSLAMYRKVLTLAGMKQPLIQVRQTK